MIAALFRWGWMLLGWLELVAVTPLMYLLSFLPQRVLESVYPPLFHYWSRVFVHALGVELRLHQHNYRPLPKRYILIANHPSAFEDIGIPALFPVRSLAKIEVRDWWIVGRISAAAGTLYVQRESRDSRAAAARKIADELALGHNIALYPEGGCMDKRLHDHFRYGAFDVSLKTGVPILPVFIHYEAQNDFYWPPKVLLVQKIWQIMTAQNKRANYHLFDAFDPADFADRESYNQHVYQCYLDWQRQYLD